MEPSKNKRICHDLKTERPDVGQPLPAVLRLLPVLFLLTVVGAAVLSTFFWFQFQEAERSRDEWTQREQEGKAANEKLVAEKAAVDAEVKKANDVKSWIAGSQGMQELVIEIVRSMAKGTNMSELTLTRDKDQPEHFNTVLRINAQQRGGAQQQIDDTIALLESLDYRTFAEQRSQGQDGAFDYSAKLVRRADG